MIWTQAARKIADLQSRIRIVQGGTCFDGSQLIITNKGSVKIKNILESTCVLSYNEITKENEWKEVKNVFKYKNTKPTVKIKLKSGKEIICTDDHRFYFQGGWIKVKHLLSLFDGNMEKNTKL